MLFETDSKKKAKPEKSNFMYLIAVLVVFSILCTIQRKF